MRLRGRRSPQIEKRTPLRRRAPSNSDQAMLSAVILSVPLGEALPLLRQIIKRKDGRHRADGHTSAAIDTFNRINVEHLFFGVRGLILLRMDAVHRAGDHAGGVLGPDARFCDYVSHKLRVPPLKRAE